MRKWSIIAVSIAILRTLIVHLQTGFGLEIPDHLTILQIVFLGPVLEELIFRGALMSFLFLVLGDGIIERRGRKFFLVPDPWEEFLTRKWLLIICLQGTIFGIGHLDPSQEIYPWWHVLNATAAGIIYGLCRWRSRSLIPGIVGHMVYNFLALF
jgi:membrane protease YdiL (CAAX protease family)